jgi:3-hydroxyisobutyrate dehydrogenase
VTGSRNQAASGELNFLVGGSAAALERARPALSAMGRSITHVGPTGSGALLKLINNFLCGVQAVSLAEAIAVMEQSGLDRAKCLDLIVNGTPGSPLFKILSGRMATRDYTPNFMLSLMAKDLAYALAEGRQHGLSLTTVSAALERFKDAAASGHSNKDFSIVVEEFRKR